MHRPHIALYINNDLSIEYTIAMERLCIYGVTYKK